MRLDRLPIASVERLLERGALPPPRTWLGRVVEGAWEHALARAAVRPLAWPSGTVVIAVGGSTLGGSGKTPLAIACAAALAQIAPRSRVALVGHAYRAAPGRARVVDPRDPLDEVGDEALLAANQLATIAREAGPAERPGPPVSVVVGPTRAAAIDLAARVADFVVLDGVVQTAPRRASLSLLAVDAHEPWGFARRVPPWGDLRAPAAHLVGAVDHVVAVGDERDPLPVPSALHARNVGRGAFLGPDLVPWAALAGMRVGLVCALARPGRVVRFLARRGVNPVALLRGRDHGPVPAPATAHRAPSGRVDLWLASPKCALHASHLILPAPLATLEHRLVPCDGLLAALTAAAAGNTLETSRNHSQFAAGPP
jgi:tetraacyldisaccharide 4'-kinase